MERARGGVGNVGGLSPHAPGIILNIIHIFGDIFMICQLTISVTLATCSRNNFDGCLMINDEIVPDISSVFILTNDSDNDHMIMMIEDIDIDVDD